MKKRSIFQDLSDQGKWQARYGNNEMTPEEQKTEQVCELVEQVVSERMHTDSVFLATEKVCNDDDFWASWRQSGKPITLDAIRKLIDSDGLSEVMSEIKQEADTHDDEPDGMTLAKEELEKEIL